jgi:hypothetical protein
MFAMAVMAQLREQQRVRVALQNGQPVPAEDYETARKVIAQARWRGRLAIIWITLGCVWLFLGYVAHGLLRWAAIFGIAAAVVNTWTLLRQRKQVLDGAAKSTPHLT